MRSRALGTTLELSIPQIMPESSLVVRCQQLFEFLLLQEVRKEFPLFVISTTDFIKILIDPDLSSNLDCRLQKHDNMEVKRLSANSIIRFLKTYFDANDCPLQCITSIREAFATSIYFKGDPELDKEMLTEHPLDTWELEDEYSIAERNSVLEPSRPTLNSLIEPLILLLTGYSSIPETPNTGDVDFDEILFFFIRERKVEFWRNQSYPEKLATTTERYLRRRGRLDPGRSIRNGWRPYPDYSPVEWE
ncbi:hypothetical protein TWF718_000391 [Orbilia javanica]|uniref:Uncharacterized protein n=1 Tax=Orbilia javanica TaxID=47235 RepID=A0AAN8MX32_9PEZI